MLRVMSTFVSFYKCSRGADWLPDFQVVFVFFKWALRSAVQCFLLVSSTLTSPCLRIQSVFFSSKLLLDAPCSSLYNGVQDIFHPPGKLQFLRLLWCRTSKWRKWSGCIQKFLNAIIPMPCHSFGAHFKTTKPFLPVTFILFIFLVQARHLWKQLDFRCFRLRMPSKIPPLQISPIKLGARWCNISKHSFPDHFYEMWKIIERKSSASSTKVARGKINMVLYIHELVSNIFQPIWFTWQQKLSLLPQLGNKNPTTG